ncbi:MAG: hypothetical protein OHK0022_24400 [Roseiflexaceae bacterium]
MLWPLPFPLPPRDEWLEVEQQQGQREQIYRSGNIALRVLDGMVVGVCVHRVWLVPSDVYALWQLLAAVLQAGAALWPGVRPDGYVVAAPVVRLTSVPLRDGEAAGVQRKAAVAGTCHRCGRVQLTTRTRPTREASLDGFGLSGLDVAAVLRDLPALLAVLCAIKD